MLPLSARGRISQLFVITFSTLIFAGIYSFAQKPILVSAHVESAGSAEPSAQSVPLRYGVETKETATFYVGQQGKFDIVLFDPYGKRVDAPTDLETTIIVTTFESLDQAKAWLNSANISPSSQKPSKTRAVGLESGQEASRTKIIHRKGEQDETVHLLSNQPGALHIFVESPNIATGETLVVVLKPRRSMKGVAQLTEQPTSEMRMMPIQYQTSRVNQVKLDFLPSRPTIYTRDGDQIAYFKVVLQSATNEFEEASREISVILQVDEGYANFTPDKLTIPKGQVVSTEQAELRTRPGGSIKVSALTSRSNNITSVTRTYSFTPGVHSTSLSVQKQRESAYANGLDEIELVVAALQDGRAITPEEEGMAERKIFFHFVGDSQGVRFENGKSEITIPKGQHTGTIKLFSVRSVGDLKVVAESRNGLRTQINSASDVPIQFAFPWLPMLCALIGGVTFPLLARHDRRGLAQGLVVGGIFFGLALFGAILSNPQKLGAVSVTLTKLPTENALASFILGFVGSVLLGVIFSQAQRYKSSNAT